jgi:FkbM family methyltransferase
VEEKFASKLNKTEKLAKASKLKRLLHNPVKYLFAIFQREIFFNRFKLSYKIKAKTFFGQSMFLSLPSGTDIFLTGGKSDDSELRLTRFLLLNLQKGDCFLDVGAHYGFYSLLAANCVGEKGRVMSIEPSSTTFKILQMNIQALENIDAYQILLSDENGPCDFFEFPNLYSEFNSINLQQYKDEKWLAKIKPIVQQVKAYTLDSLLQLNKNIPNIIKIDAEGAEANIIKGGRQYLKNENIEFVVMEYLDNKRSNGVHKMASQNLFEAGYKSYIINNDGSINTCEDVEEYFHRYNITSDNIVFRKENKNI